jgi:Fur family ferric uptake transcriptional regulator
VHHHHLACRNCGAAVEVDAPELEHWAQDIAGKYDYVDLHHVLELNGICATCQSH